MVPTLALYDTMQYVRSPTATVCYGLCLGMGGFLLTAGGEKVRGSCGAAGLPTPPTSTATRALGQGRQLLHAGQGQERPRPPC